MTALIHTRKEQTMTIRYVTVEGSYKIIEVTEVEIEPVTNTNINVHNGKMMIREVKEEKK